jgi:beta-phosphoglucomutase-like phosphatase (HAD superfamily)
LIGIVFEEFLLELSMIKYIIFDNDGVNIDSEDKAMRVMDDWGGALVRYYKPDADLPQDYIYRTYPGTSTDKIVEALIQKFALPSEQIVEDYGLSSPDDVPTQLADLITLETNRVFKNELKSIPGTTAALIEIRSLFGTEHVALATTSRADRMDISLAHAVDSITGDNARLDELFPKGEQRRSGYGHPNKYDEAFAALGWDPAETIVVEDSISGVTKAMAGRPDTSVIGTVAAKFYENKEEQAAKLLANGAKIVISDMADLLTAVTWLKEGMNADARPDFASRVYMATPATLAATLNNTGLNQRRPSGSQLS